MPVYKGSRYATANVTNISDGTNSKRYIHSRNYIDANGLSNGFVNHIIQEGDTCDSLAYQYFGDGKLWWIIADINDVINPLDDLVSNEVFKIPKYDIFTLGKFSSR